MAKRTIWVVLAIVFVVALILQVFYIHFQLSKYKESIVKRKIDAQNSISMISRQDTKLRIYGLVVDLDLSSLLYSTGGDLKKAILDVVSSRTTEALPYVCDVGVKSVPVKIDKVALLVIHENHGGSRLQLDLETNNVKYIVINQTVYMARAFSNLRNDVIAPFFENNNMMSTAEKFDGRIIIVLYPLANHTLIETEGISKDCHFALQPFIGEFRLFGGSGEYIDVATQVFNGMVSGSGHPVHAIAYKAA